MRLSCSLNASLSRRVLCLAARCCRDNQPCPGPLALTLVDFKLSLRPHAEAADTMDGAQQGAQQQQPTQQPAPPAQPAHPAPASNGALTRQLVLSDDELGWADTCSGACSRCAQAAARPTNPLVCVVVHPHLVLLVRSAYTHTRSHTHAVLPSASLAAAEKSLFPNSMPVRQLPGIHSFAPSPANSSPAGGAASPAGPASAGKAGSPVGSAGGAGTPLGLSAGQARGAGGEQKRFGAGSGECWLLSPRPRSVLSGRSG